MNRFCCFPTATRTPTARNVFNNTVAGIAYAHVRRVYDYPWHSTNHTPLTPQSQLQPRRARMTSRTYQREPSDNRPPRTIPTRRGTLTTSTSPQVSQPVDQPASPRTRIEHGHDSRLRTNIRNMKSFDFFFENRHVSEGMWFCGARARDVQTSK